MQDYAVVKIAHRQYIVEPGKEYVVDKLAGEPGTKLDLEVLAFAKAGKLEVGKPIVSGVKAEIEVLEQGKGEKIDTRLFKAKSRYRRHTGHRARLTKFKVLNIK